MKRIWPQKTKREATKTKSSMVNQLEKISYNVRLWRIKIETHKEIYKYSHIGLIAHKIINNLVHNGPEKRIVEESCQNLLRFESFMRTWALEFAFQKLAVLTVLTLFFLRQRDLNPHLASKHIIDCIDCELSLEKWRWSMCASKAKCDSSLSSFRARIWSWWPS